MTDTYMPGPWTIQNQSDTAWYDIVQQQTGAVVAADLNLPDARLVAHAPEAHALVREALEYCATFDDGLLADEQGRYWKDRARAYLAAVEGRTDE